MHPMLVTQMHKLPVTPALRVLPSSGLHKVLSPMYASTTPAICIYKYIKINLKKKSGVSKVKGGGKEGKGGCWPAVHTPGPAWRKHPVCCPGSHGGSAFVKLHRSKFYALASTCYARSWVMSLLPLTSTQAKWFSESVELAHPLSHRG